MEILNKQLQRKTTTGIDKLSPIVGGIVKTDALYITPNDQFRNCGKQLNHIMTCGDSLVGFTDDSVLIHRGNIGYDNTYKYSNWFATQNYTSTAKHKYTTDHRNYILETSYGQSKYRLIKFTDEEATVYDVPFDDDKAILCSTLEDNNGSYVYYIVSKTKIYYTRYPISGEVTGDATTGWVETTNSQSTVMESFIDSEFINFNDPNSGNAYFYAISSTDGRVFRIKVSVVSGAIVSIESEIKSVLIGVTNINVVCTTYDEEVLLFGRIDSSGVAKYFIINSPNQTLASETYMAANDAVPAEPTTDISSNGFAFCSCVKNISSSATNGYFNFIQAVVHSGWVNIQTVGYRGTDDMDNAKIVKVLKTRYKNDNKVFLLNCPVRYSGDERYYQYIGIVVHNTLHGTCDFYTFDDFGDWFSGTGTTFDINSIRMSDNLAFVYKARHASFVYHNRDNLARLIPHGTSKYVTGTYTGSTSNIQWGTETVGSYTYHKATVSIPVPNTENAKLVYIWKDGGTFAVYSPKIRTIAFCTSGEVYNSTTIKTHSGQYGAVTSSAQSIGFTYLTNKQSSSTPSANEYYCAYRDFFNTQDATYGYTIIY